MTSPPRTSTDLLEPLVGKLVVEGRYRIHGVLGRGGMCAVYRAEQLSTGRIVAMKVLPVELAATPELVARFEREATIGRRIEHPHVVAILDSGRLHDGSLYLVMELLEGRSLADVLERGAVDPARALELSAQMLSALEAAHLLGITHRDVKPDNIMLIERDGRELAKLVDFGIASNDRAAFKLTVAGVAFGTPEYISPEMAMGLAVDPRADLYSLGIVLFELLTGRLPFAHKDMKRLLQAHVYENPPSPRAIAPGARISEALEAVILRAIAKLPEQRFGSADEMRKALLACVPHRSWLRRWAVPIAVGLAVAAAALWWGLGRDAPPPAAAVDDRPARSSPPRSTPTRRRHPGAPVRAP